MPHKLKYDVEIKPLKCDPSNRVVKAILAKSTNRRIAPFSMKKIASPNRPKWSFLRKITDFKSSTLKSKAPETVKL